jgi:predicted membrane protein
MEDRDSGLILAIGGMASVVILGLWALKFLRSLFKELTKTFDAFGTLAASSFSMLGNALVAALLIAGIIATVVAAVYFTYKYIMMVKRATEIRESVESSLNKTKWEMTEAFHGFRSEVEREIDRMNRELTEALKEPEPVPLLPTAKADEEKPALIETSSDPSIVESAEEDSEIEPPISQPY